MSVGCEDVDTQDLGEFLPFSFLLRLFLPLPILVNINPVSAMR